MTHVIILICVIQNVNFHNCFFQNDRNTLAGAGGGAFCDFMKLALHYHNFHFYFLLLFYSSYSIVVSFFYKYFSLV